MAENKTVAALNAAVFLLMVGVGLIVALLPRRIMTLSASVSDVAILASAFAIPYVLLQIPVGNLSDRFGFKRFLVGGYLLCGLTGFLYFFADTPALYFGGRFLQGIAEVPIWALAPALLSVIHRSDKGKFIGLYNASLHCGLTLGGLLSIVIPEIWQGNEPFLLYAALSLLGGLTTALFVENPDARPLNQRPAAATAGLGKLMADRATLVVFSGIALYGAGYGIFITIIPAFLIEARDVAQGTIGVFFAFFYVALSLSQLYAGKWSDRRGRKPVMAVGLLVAAFGIAVFHRCLSPLFIVFLALASLGLGMFCVAAMAFLNERVPRSLKGTISGAFYFSWGAGYFFGPLLMGRIGSSVGYHAAFSLFSVLMMLQLLAISMGVAKRQSALLQDE